MALLLNLLASKLTREGLCLTARASAEVGWGRELGCGIGVMDVTITDAKCKRQPKEKTKFELNLNLGLDRFGPVTF